MGCGSSANNQTETKPAQTTADNNAKGNVKGTADNSAKNQNAPKPTQTDNAKGSVKADDSQKTKGSNNSSNQFMNDAIQSHNKYRAMHGAPPMTSAEELIDYAQKYADELASLDTMRHSKCTLPSGGRVGENLYCYWSSDVNAAPTADMAVSSWYDEIKDYNFSSPGFAMDTGHFTQVVWKGSTELGMAWAKAAKGTTYVVANYRPAGNMMGDFENNVLPK